MIYVDLWSDTQTSPAVLVLAAVRKTLAELQTPASSILQKLKRVGGADVGAFGFKFGFKLDSVGTEGGPTLARALTEVVDQAQTNVVLIIDEVQHAITSVDGNQMLLALKSARDAINTRPGKALRRCRLLRSRSKRSERWATGQRKCSRRFDN